MAIRIDDALASMPPRLQEEFRRDVARGVRGPISDAVMPLNQTLLHRQQRIEQQDQELERLRYEVADLRQQLADEKRQHEITQGDLVRTRLVRDEAISDLYAIKQGS